MQSLMAVSRGLKTEPTNVFDTFDHLGLDLSFNRLGWRAG